jgi:hypothetical protein
VRPFNLILAEPGAVLWWRYDGSRLSRHEVPTWGGWPALLADVDTPYDDPRALNVRRGGADGVFGTVSASLLSIGAAGIKYEFCPGPPDRAPLQQVL